MCGTGERCQARKLVLEVQEQRSKSGSPARGASCPTLAEWLAGRYARWQERAQNERTGLPAVVIALRAGRGHAQLSGPVGARSQASIPVVTW